MTRVVWPIRPQGHGWQDFMYGTSRSCGPHSFRDFPILGLLELLTPRAWQVWTPVKIYVEDIATY